MDGLEVSIAVGMRLSRRISRQRNVRYTTASIFIGTGFLSTFAWVVLGHTGILWVGSLAVLTGIGILFVPTDRMDDRWFHALPVIVVVEISLASMSLAPDGAAIIGLFAFAGPAIAFMIETPRAIVAHIAFATLALLAPLVLVETSAVTVVASLCMIPITWGLGIFVMLVWQHAEDGAQQLELLARRDPLTGIGNRRVFEERLDYEMTRHERSGRELALIVLDLNGFKTINDELGHSAGDAVLQGAAAALGAAVRSQDTVARQGGDEFCVLAPEAGPLEAAEIVAHIRGALASVDAAGRPLEAAIGYAVYPGDARDTEDLVELADARQRADKVRPAVPLRLPAAPRFGRDSAA